jgi:OmcA/MtrC family decaheme c-type cytochrome
MRKAGAPLILAASLLLGHASGQAQTPAPAPAPAWNVAPQFRYNIENILVSTPVPGNWDVKVVFSITNPSNGLVWDIKTDLPYQTAGASLTLDIAWDVKTDFVNTGSANALLTPVSSTALGTAPAAPIQVRNLQSLAAGASRCTTSAQCPGVADFFNRFWVEKRVTPIKFTQNVTTGRVALEGHPVCNGLVACPPGPPYANIPVRSETADFAFVSSATPVRAVIADPRRQIVDFDTKCVGCHNGTKLDRAGVPIPRLSLHGNNRTENLKLCVMCHNPNQTDVAYRVITADARTSAAETSIDFKRMVHSIHAGGFRSTAFTVIGFNTSINDFSGVRFPSSLRNCLNCHTETNGKGSFELPLQASVLGSTIKTGSLFAVAAGALRSIDVNPSNDLKISPTAATCSGCHDKAEVQSHMVRTGKASFSTTQAAIGVTVKERCASCHGPGQEEDVRKAHELLRGTGGGHAGGNGD